MPTAFLGLAHCWNSLAWLSKPPRPRSPWQNPYVERLIDTVRRECLDRMLIFGEAHLRQTLSSYAAYYNGVRTHLALGKDAPLGRALQRPSITVAIPILSRLHHHYVRIMIFGKDKSDSGGPWHEQGRSCHVF